ncbi:hypothetical protein PSM7751_02800 [Pseudooceanicola marinus]|uniref:Flagellar FliJ protein n=1 Tax=Pseudooceanicola marinus TaxID=396013 RepID=A0A1X6ZNH8_9RHOB|nr:hypothetical protein [Pseudooceanicola marinus]PJE26668.1 hypothetical protein CVM50_18395 [Pseudooceanicola marinus]SLN56435.1 hypothetical protein PSM7751_02800 [Pseudooceanicola marinus]
MPLSRKTKALEPIAEATSMAFETELMQLRRIAARERQLRLSLEALEKRAADRFLDQVDELSGSDLTFADGQDRAWRDWISTRRSNLQAELALVLADKSERMGQLTRALGRRDIAARLHGASLSVDRRAALARELAGLQDLAVLLKGRARQDRLN